ncbi:MAG: AEC family transporter [Actinomycetota bacterium]
MNSILSLALEVLGITIPIFAVIIIGYLIRVKGIISDAGVLGLNKIAYNIGLPALILISIAQYNLSEIFNARIIGVIYSSYLIYIIIIFAGAKFSREPGRVKGALMVSSYRCNMAFIGFPIIISAFGGLALAKASLVVAFLTPVNIVTTVLLFKIYNRREEGIKAGRLLRELAVDPLILSAVLGIIISYINISIPRAVSSVLDILSSMVIGLALLAIGASFRFFHIKSYIRLLVFISIAKLLVMPAIAFLMAEFVFKLNNVDRNVTVLLFSMPLAVAAYIMAKQYRSEADLVSSALIITTVISSVTVSVWLLVLKVI